MPTSSPPSLVEIGRRAKAASRLLAGASSAARNEALLRSADLLEHTVNEGKKDFTVSRYKGLGEMNAEQLWETTMNPERRNLLRVELGDLMTDDGQEIFALLMGEDVEERRKFIQEHALDVKNLDI